MTASPMKLTGVTTLIVDDDLFGVNILHQMLRGFGLEQTRIVKTASAAKAFLEHHVYDLCICNSLLPDMDAADFVKWIRGLKAPGRFVPILVLTSYSRLHTVTSMRDAGAHMVIKKPVSPRVLYDRIAWAARFGRPFVEAREYKGPDRRFQSLQSPDGIGRRDSDPAPETTNDANGAEPQTEALEMPAKAAVG